MYLTILLLAQNFKVNTLAIFLAHFFFYFIHLTLLPKAKTALQLLWRNVHLKHVPNMLLLII